MKNSAFVVLAALALLACESQFQYTPSKGFQELVAAEREEKARRERAKGNPDEVAKQTTFSYDKYEKTSSIDGPWFTVQAEHDHISKAKLYVTKRANRVSGPYLYVYLGTPDWYFIDTAHADFGEQLTFVQIDREVITSSLLIETGLVVLPMETLEAHRDSGFVIRISGTRGAFEIPLEPSYIDGYLRAAEDALASLES
jgi:hypothetical protein